MNWLERRKRLGIARGGLAIGGTTILACLTADDHGNHFILSCLASSLALASIAPLSRASRPYAIVASTILAVSASVITNDLIGSFPDRMWIAALLTMLAMVITKTEHPPAAAIPLVLSNQIDLAGAIGRLIVGACLVAAIAHLSRHLLRNRQHA